MTTCPHCDSALVAAGISLYCPKCYRPGTLSSALMRLRVSGRIKPGSDAWAFLTDGDHYAEPWLSDIDDLLEHPATLGCLLALVREADGDPRLYVAFQPDAGEEWWCVCDENDNVQAGGDSEGAALAAALCALAEGV